MDITKNKIDKIMWKNISRCTECPIKRSISFPSVYNCYIGPRLSNIFKV